MGQNKHIGILGVAVTGLLALGACGSKPTTLAQTDAPTHEHVQAINANRVPDGIHCAHTGPPRC